MPCTLQHWEVLYEERQANKKKYGIDVADIALITGLLCEACKKIPKKKMSAAMLIWCKAHRQLDKKHKNGA